MGASSTNFLILLVVGCFMEAISAMLIPDPDSRATDVALGIGPTQFGVIVVLNLMIGTITPPVGIVLFITARVANLPFDKVCKATLPFLWPWLAFSSPSLSFRHDHLAPRHLQVTRIARAATCRLCYTTRLDNTHAGRHHPARPFS